MSALPNIIPITDLRQDASSLVKQLNKTRAPLFITQRGRAAAVMMSIDAYQQTQQQLEILTLLAQGEKEIAARKGYDLESVFSDADELLKGLSQ